MTPLARAAGRAFPLAMGALCLAGPALSDLRASTADPADDIRRLLLEVLGAWLVFAVALRSPWRLTAAQRRALWPVGAFSVWVVLTALLSPWPWGSVAAAWPTLVGLGVAALAIAHPLRPRDTGTWGLALALGATIACLWALSPGAPADARAAASARFAYSSTFGNPESFAGVLAVTLCIAAAGFLARPAAPLALRLAALAAGALWLVLLLATASRGPVLALGAGLAAALFAVRPSWLRRRGVWAAAGAGLALLLTAHLALGDRSPAAALVHRVGETFDPASASTQHRWAVWRVSASLAAERPLIGQGWGMFEFLFQVHLADLLATDPAGTWSAAAEALSGRVPYHAHCDYLEVLVSTGWPGLVLLLWLLAGAFAAGWRGARRPDSWQAVKAAALAALVCLSVIAVVSFPLHRPFHQALFWLSLGLCRRPT